VGHEAKFFVLAVGVMLMVSSAAGQPFQLMEASINEIHRGFESGKLTCHSLVQQYLDRIKAYDQQGPTLNALLYVNPKVLEQADAMDKQFKRGTELKPLQGIPVVLKDNFGTADMPTTGASLALQGMHPTKDAFTVNRLRIRTGDACT
jgi:amidase